MSKHIGKEYTFIPDKALYETKISDEMQCFTDYEPRADSTVGNLTHLIVEQNNWKENVFENFLSLDILKKSKERGYLDVKNLYYGNKESGVLSFEIKGKSLTHTHTHTHAQTK